MILIGSCSRAQLIRSLEMRVGEAARKRESNLRQNRQLKHNQLFEEKQSIVLNNPFKSINKIEKIMIKDEESQIEGR